MFFRSQHVANLERNDSRRAIFFFEISQHRFEVDHDSLMDHLLKVEI